MGVHKGFPVRGSRRIGRTFVHLRPYPIQCICPPRKRIRLCVHKGHAFSHPMGQVVQEGRRGLFDGVCSNRQKRRHDTAESRRCAHPFRRAWADMASQGLRDGNLGLRIPPVIPPRPHWSESIRVGLRRVLLPVLQSRRSDCRGAGSISERPRALPPTRQDGETTLEGNPKLRACRPDDAGRLRLDLLSPLEQR